MVLQGDFERHFDRGRTVVGVKNPGQFFGQKVAQKVRKPERRLADKPGHEDLLDFIDLLLYRGGDVRMVVAEDAHPPRPHGVDKFAPCFVVDVNTRPRSITIGG